MSHTIVFNESISGGYVALLKSHGKTIVLGRSDVDSEDWRKKMKRAARNFGKPQRGREQATGETE